MHLAMIRSLRMAPISTWSLAARRLILSAEQHRIVHTYARSSGFEMREINGGCLCGQVRYSSKADPAFVGVCHCKNCQKQTGTAFSVLVGLPTSALSIEGKIKTF